MAGSPSLRSKLGGSEPVCAPLVLNPLMARLAEEAGFEALYLGGGAMGYAKGTLEALLTMTEMAEAGLELRATTSLPLVLDGACGWGDPMHVHRTIATVEAAGFDAIEIEDSVVPKRAHHHAGVEQLVPAALMAAKVREAVAARRSPDFVVIARTNATDLDEAARRADAYRQAGADLLLVTRGIGRPDPDRDRGRARRRPTDVPDPDRWPGRRRAVAHRSGGAGLPARRRRPDAAADDVRDAGARPTKSSRGTAWPSAPGRCRTGPRSRPRCIARSGSMPCSPSSGRPSTSTDEHAPTTLQVGTTAAGRAGVLESRGAGAGVVTPSRVTNDSRATRWGATTASPRSSTSFTQASVPANRVAQYVRGSAANWSSSSRRSDGHRERSPWGQSPGSSPMAREELLVHRRLEAAHGDEAVVRAAIGPVEGGAAVDEVRLAVQRPLAAGAQVVVRRHQVADAVDHGGVDHLALARTDALVQRQQDADDEVERAASEVADEVQRRGRGTVGAAAARAGRRSVRGS